MDMQRKLINQDGVFLEKQIKDQAQGQKRCWKN